MYDNLLPFHGVPSPYFLYTKTETGCEICKGHHDCGAQGPGCYPGSFIWFSTCRAAATRLFVMNDLKRKHVPCAGSLKQHCWSSRSLLRVLTSLLPISTSLLHVLLPVTAVFLRIITSVITSLLPVITVIMNPLLPIIT